MRRRIAWVGAVALLLVLQGIAQAAVVTGKVVHVDPNLRELTIGVKNPTTGETQDKKFTLSPQTESIGFSTLEELTAGTEGFGSGLGAGLGFVSAGSSVFAAMQIGLWMGYQHIYILGCDMTEIDGKLHFYGVNPDVKPDERRRRFDAEATHYDKAAELLNAEQRSQFTFCTAYNPYSFVDKFGRMPHQVAIETILERAKELKDGD